MCKEGVWGEGVGGSCRDAVDGERHEREEGEGRESRGNKRHVRGRQEGEGGMEGLCGWLSNGMT